MKEGRLCGRVQRGVERLKICIQSADLKPPAYLSSGPGFEGLKTEFKPHNASAAATSAPFPTPTWDLAQPGTAIVCVCVRTGTGNYGLRREWLGLLFFFVCGFVVPRGERAGAPSSGSPPGQGVEDKGPSVRETVERFTCQMHVNHLALCLPASAVFRFAAILSKPRVSDLEVWVLHTTMRTYH